MILQTLKKYYCDKYDADLLPCVAAEVASLSKKISCVVVKCQFLFESVQNQLFIKQDRGQNLKGSIRLSQNVLIYNHLTEWKGFWALKN